MAIKQHCWTVQSDGLVDPPAARALKSHPTSLMWRSMEPIVRMDGIVKRFGGTIATLSPPERMVDIRPNRPRVIQSCYVFADKDGGLYITDTNAGLCILQYGEG